MDDAPKRRRRHPWTLIRWAVVAVFVVLWIPSFFDLSLAWMWIGFGGLVFLCFSLVLSLAPNWLLRRREWFIEGTPRWAQRFSSRRPPSTRALRLGGAAAGLVGVLYLYAAIKVLIGADH